MTSDVATWAGAAPTLGDMMHPRRAHLTELYLCQFLAHYCPIIVSVVSRQACLSWANGADTAHGELWGPTR